MQENTAASRTKKRVILTAGAVLVAAITVLGVLQLRPSGAPAPAADDSPPPELTASDITNQFLTALTSGDAAGAGKLTDDPDASTAQLAAVWQTLRPSSATADRIAPVAPAPDATAVDERFTLTWQLGTQRTWTYESALRVVKAAAGWRVQWQPTLVHPRLAAGQSLALRDVAGQPAVVDRDGTQLVTWTTNGTSAADPAVAPLLVGGLGRVAAEQGSAGGWYVALVDAAGADVEVLHGTPTAPHVATLSVPVQKAAQAAVDTQQNPAALVAIQPSTGDILAVAQN
ncbi:NTF2-like N-terminal transpeptidase domain-containing protein, partial [Actinophytocola sp.]|uniref:NTF2-like N-terminal transpeptidase domain-containing protein n=1 Tax=Actinophytocola sp. TaxID=1872138 RepID=UPI002ED1669C